MGLSTLAPEERSPRGWRHAHTHRTKVSRVEPNKKRASQTLGLPAESRDLGSDSAGPSGETQRATVPMAGVVHHFGPHERLRLPPYGRVNVIVSGCPSSARNLASCLRSRMKIADNSSAAIDRSTAVRLTENRLLKLVLRTNWL